jgi:hypothetical protein
VVNGEQRVARVRVVPPVRDQCPSRVDADSLRAVGGDCTLTPSRIVVENEAGVTHTRLSPQAVRSGAARASLEEVMLEPGDGRVTKPSLLARETIDPTAPQHEESFLPVAYHFFLCERHDQLTGNVSFQNNLLNVLLTPDLPWLEPARR